MRLTIYVNEETDQEVIEHLEKLKLNGDNRSRFFVNAAKKCLKPKNDLEINLKSLVKEIIAEEYKNLDKDKLGRTNDIIDISDKLKNVYD